MLSMPSARPEALRSRRLAVSVSIVRWDSASLSGAATVT